MHDKDGEREWIPEFLHITHLFNRIDPFDPDFGSSDHQDFFSFDDDFVLVEKGLPFPPWLIVLVVVALFVLRFLTTVDNPELIPLRLLGIDPDLPSPSSPSSSSPLPSSSCTRTLPFRFFEAPEISIGFTPFSHSFLCIRNTAMVARASTTFKEADNWVFWKGWRHREIMTYTAMFTVLDGNTQLFFN